MADDPSATGRLDWFELLDALETRTGVFVTRPRLLGAGALLWGYGMGRGDEAMRSFQTWASHRFPAEGGHPSPLGHEYLVARDMFDRTPLELSEAEDLAAAQRLCQLVREFLRETLHSDG